MGNDFVVIFDLDDTLIHTKEYHKFFSPKNHESIILHNQEDIFSDTIEYGDGACGKCIYTDESGEEFTVFKRGGFDSLVNYLKNDAGKLYDICIFTASTMPDDFIKTSLKKLYGSTFDNIPIFRAMYQDSVEKIKSFIGNRNFILIDDNDKIANYKISLIYDRRMIDNITFNKHVVLIKPFIPFQYKPFVFEINLEDFEVINGVLYDQNHDFVLHDLQGIIEDKIKNAINKNMFSILKLNQRKLEDQTAVKNEGKLKKMLKYLFD